MNFLWPGRYDVDGKISDASERYVELFTAEPEGMWTWLNPGREGLLNASYAGSSPTLESHWCASFGSPAGNHVP